MIKEQKKSLQYQTKATDVTKEGIVTVAVNGIGIEDSQHDISMPGSFAKTVKEDIGRMRWLLNHRLDQLLGVPLKGEEKDDNLIMTGRLNLQKQIGRDTLADYELFAQEGRTLEHSIGVIAKQRDKADKRKVLEWQMFEYSTLHSWGANPNTYLVGIKSGTEQQIRDAVEFIRKAMEQRGYSDERLKHYDMELELLLKSLNGGTVVSCPCCGHQFDYDSQDEHTFSEVIRDAALDWLRCTGVAITREQMEAYRPEVREQVLAVIDSMKGRKADLTEKSITDALAYVRCPNCWSRVYRTDSIRQEEKTEKEEEKADKQEEEKVTEKADSFWRTLNEQMK